MTTSGHDKCYANYGFHLPKPENPMTDVMSPSSLILPDAAKDANTVFTTALVILLMMKSVNGFAFHFSLKGSEITLRTRLLM